MNILQIAEEEGFTEIEATSVQSYSCTRDELERFAARIRAEQKEKSAKIFMFEPSEMWMARDAADAIRNSKDEK